MLDVELSNLVDSNSVYFQIDLARGGTVGL